jgi:predicted short-subunit dehydrogenase-like oxidoreductase (DUF2520 family)
MKMQQMIAIVGGGRMGRALTDAFSAAGVRVTGPHGRGFAGAGADAVLLCVPDGQIAGAAAAVAPGPLVGHCSGATGLGVLAPHEAFALHPLMTITRRGGDFRGAGAAVAGSSDRALALATELARALGMRPFEIADEDRAAYHAGAAMASNFLVALESAAQRMAGVDRELLAPLVRAAVETWIAEGDAALTGPIARGDAETVARHREAIAERAPELLALYEVLAEATRAVAARAAGDGAQPRTVAASATTPTAAARGAALA